MKFIAMADECVKEAQALYDAQFYGGCISRCYFAVFNSIRSALQSKGIMVKPHEKLLTLFNLHFIKTGIFSKEIKDIFQHLKELRLEADYKPTVKLGSKDAENALIITQQFLDTIKNYMNAKS